MQNFTLRFKGKMFYLFALTFLIGSLPSIYGQACPTVDNASQSFCNALSTVADLDANGDNIVWYDTATSTTPLPMDEILQDGEDYFADSPDCTDPGYSRPSVTVSITGPATPVVQDDFFTPCAGGGPYTVADLKEAIDAAAPPSGYTLEIFSTRYGKNDTPLADSDPLSVGNYYAGYYDADTNCQSMRKPVRFEPVEATAPTATSPQTVCEGTTVSELEAEGTNLWYRTATSQPALPDDFEVKDGETYYASQIVPADGPPCESEDRTAVTVTVLPADAGPDNTDNTLCVSEADSQLNNTTNARNYFLSLLENNNDSNPSNDVPTNGTFDMATLDQIVADYNDGTKTGTYQTTYTATFDGGCEDSVVLGVEVVADPYAGEDTSLTYCQSDLQTIINGVIADPSSAEATFLSLINGSDIDTGGTFNPSLSDVATTYLNDVATNNFPATYTVEYTVSNEGCSDTSTLSLTVLSDPDPGTDNSETLCETDVEDMGIFNTVADAKAYYLNLLGTGDTSGSFDPPLADLKAAYDDGVTSPSETFETTYTVDNGTCSASATATLTVNAAEPAEAGTIADQQYCTNDGTQNLNDLLDSSAIPGGVFSSPDADVAGGSFDPAAEGAGTYNITYTVSQDNPDLCVSGTDTATFTVTVYDAPNAGSDLNLTFCQGEIETFITDPDLRNTLLGMLGSDVDTDGTFDPTLTEIATMYAGTTTFPATFTTEYTVSNTECSDTAVISVTVNPNTEVNAGGDQEATFCTTDGTQDLTTLLGDGATMGGTFSSDDADVSDGMFDPSLGAGEYVVTYSVDGSSDPCLTGNDSATLTITVIEGVNAGEDMTDVVCQDEIDTNFFTEDALTTYFQGLLSDGVPTDGTFDPSIASLVDDYNNGKTTGDFTTTYTVSNGTCEASVKLTLTVREPVTADLTEVDDQTLCQNAGVQDLRDFIGDNPDFGVFTYDGNTIEDGMFNPGEMGPGTYDITYTLDESATPCVTGSDSITFTITVQESAYAGMPISFAVCQNAGKQNLFTRLSDATDDTGEFTYNGSVLADGIMNPANFDPGTYEVVYTVPSENDCGEDITILSVTVRGVPNAGENMSREVCQNDDTVDLFSLLGADTDKNGKFVLGGNTIQDGLMDPSDYDAGTYNISYVVSNNNGACSDTAIFTITVKDAANAGEDMTFDVCTNAGTQDLYSYLSADADTDGTFTLDGDVITDGEMDPATFDAGTYTVTYTVAAINDCGDDSSTFEITVNEAPDAPEVNDISYCAIQSPTGADLMAEGDNLTFYTDADLTMMVAAEDELVSGTYYVTQRSDSDCESDATEFTVTINDPGSPTIDNANLSFCEYDDATVADLSEAVDQTSNVTWFSSEDGTEPLSTGTALQSGDYYGSLYDPDTDCESSQRLKVTVTIEDCPLLFPEGISPNGDGLNDTFDIQNIEREFPNYSIQIYNRWGDVVYKGDANTPDWDGTANQSGSFGSDVLPVGVYFYLLDFNDGVTAPKKGKIYLSR